MVAKPAPALKQEIPPLTGAGMPAITRDLLAWYDRHARVLPWRERAPAQAEPYRVWLSEIMLQQTTVEAVKPYFARFLARWPDIAALARASDQEILAAWAGLGYYARARNLIACARRVAEQHGGRFPGTEAELRALPGIGAYTAAAIAAIAFGERAVVIDGNVERVASRLFAIATPLPAAKPEIRAALAPLVPGERPGDFAQGMMDLGATICTPRRPDCLICPLDRVCQANAAGDPEGYPRKATKRVRPVRYGMAFVVRDAQDRLLLRTRPLRGLLAGMSEVPGSSWSEAAPGEASPPFDLPWRAVPEQVVHIFTHFELRLEIRAARLSTNPAPPEGMRWVASKDLSSEPLPTLMRKVIAAAG
jgi:A/G-specific adenine glycosylase